jgi:hypothetical protein
LDAFVAMQHCMARHPQAFADFVSSREESDADEDEMEAVIAAASDLGSQARPSSMQVSQQKES